MLCNFSGFSTYITLTCITVPFIDVFSYEKFQKMQNLCNFVVRNILEVKNTGNCEEEVSILQYTVYRKERERERERESRGVPAFFVSLQFLTLTFPRYKTEIQIERETEKAVIKFSICSLMDATVTSCDVECSRMRCQTMSLNEDNLQILVIVHRFRKK